MAMPKKGSLNAQKFKWMMNLVFKLGFLSLALSTSTMVVRILDGESRRMGRENLTDF